MISPAAARIFLGVSLGMAMGVGAYTFVYAKGGSYFTNDPAACANCHIMQEYYDGWSRASHRAVAVCNDCHTPPGVVGKYLTKASNGFWHSFAFTTGWHPDPLRITPRNRDIARRACDGCHQDIVQAIEGVHPGRPERNCVQCHDSVGHLR
jgi:cytochrome c nitrite reductase small subunit